jgi:hypothetical protein
VQQDKSVFTQVSLIKTPSESGRLWAHVFQAAGDNRLKSAMYQIPPGMSVGIGSVVKVEVGSEFPRRGAFIARTPNRIVEVVPELKCRETVHEVLAHDRRNE